MSDSQRPAGARRVRADGVSMSDDSAKNITRKLKKKTKIQEKLTRKPER